ncbi:MAG: hypothetical protein V2I36_14580 [Desulfopila sp.]|jgi:hypothetical protein|nr:hypothetical protein [Desulfopila sp.]
MRKQLLEKSLEQIRYIMALQYCAILFMILCGGTIFGIRTDRWVEAAEIVEILAILVTFFMPMAYLRVRSLVKAYCDSRLRSESEVIFLGGAESPVLSGRDVAGRIADMPYI